jgi:hypothetical protein
VYFELKKDTLVMFYKNFENTPVVFIKNQELVLPVFKLFLKEIVFFIEKKLFLFIRK